MSFQLPKDDGGEPIQVAVGTGARANLTAGSTSSNAALPTGAKNYVIVRATDAVWLNFGTSGVTASAAASSQLFVAGETVVPVSSSATHAAVLRVGSADVPVQIETIK